MALVVQIRHNAVKYLCYVAPEKIFIVLFDVPCFHNNNEKNQRKTTAKTKF